MTVPRSGADPIRILAIGSCRLFKPLAASGLAYRLPDSVDPYRHNTLEALQALRDPVLERTSIEAVVIEISSRATFHHADGRLMSRGAIERDHGAVLSDVPTRRRLRVPFDRRGPPGPAAALPIVEKCQDDREVGVMLDEIRRVAGHPLVIVGHFVNDHVADALAQSRRALNGVLGDWAAANAVRFVDPTAIAGRADFFLDQDHYSERAMAPLGRGLRRIVRRAILSG